MSDAFDWVEDIEPTEEDLCNEYEETQTIQRKSARDYIRAKAAKKLDGDGVSPAYKQGYAAGWVEGHAEGEKRGYEKGLAHARKQFGECELPE